MQIAQQKYFPTTIEAIHLLVLYIFLEALVDFPLALYDYMKDTNWLANPYISFISSVTITGFIFYYGFRKTKTSFSNTFAIKAFQPLIIVPILIVLPAMQYLVGFLNAGVERILPAPPWFWELFERVMNNRFGFWGAVVRVAIIAPIVEEVLFRGIIMHGLMRNYRSWYAILMSGLLFSFFHLNPWQMTYTFFLGLLLGWIMVRTKSLPLCILIHALNNLLVMLSVIYEKQFAHELIFQFSLRHNLLIGFGLLLVGLLLIFLFSKPGKMKSSQIA